MTRRCSLAMVLGAVLSLAATQTSAQIALSQTTFEAGTDFAAFFQVVHGCGSSPTTALRVQIPEGVEVLRLPEKRGWSVSAERTSDRMVAAVTWKGSLEAEQSDQFGLFVRLPERTGPLYFAATQRCATQEIRWTEIPAEGVAHPAPMLMLVAATPGTQAHHASPIAVETPWSRATPPGAPTGVAYMTIVNRGSEPDVLVGASSPQAATVEIHQTSMTDGVMRMRPVTGGVTVPGGGAIELKPDGYHLMLVGLKAPLKSGSMLPITLRFAKAGSIDVEFAVEPIGARAPSSAAAPEHDHH